MGDIADVCRVCSSPEPRRVLDLGRVPLANRFIDPEATDSPEPTYALGLQFCPTCAIAQLPEAVDLEILFRHYLYTPSASATWRAHCDELAAWIHDYVREQGAFSHIPVVGPEQLQGEPVDVLLILAWNIVSEVIEQQRWFADRGGRFLIPIPEPHFVG